MNTKAKKEPWQIVAARFCVERKEFTLKELETFLEKNPHDIPHEHVRNYFIENIQNPQSVGMIRLKIPKKPCGA